MSKRSDAVKRWRDTTKARMVAAMGGKCSICNYDRCHAALDFHHINPKEKDFGFGSVTANPKAWAKIVIELRKCVLLCSNCHREVEAGATVVPESAPSFNEDYAEYRQGPLTSPCVVCGKEKPIVQITCSLSCAGKRAWVVDWDNVDLLVLLNKVKWNWCEAGRTLGISDNAVRKRAKKLNIAK